MLLAILGTVFTCLAFAGAAYALLAAFFANRFARRAPLPPPVGYDAVTLLKPLHGAEPALEENLESFLIQEYPGPVQIVFGVHDAADPAVAVVERLRVRHPGADIAMTVEAGRLGTNPKMSNVLTMAGAAKHGILILSDSDIAVAPDYLRGIVAALENAGAVTCLYTGWAAAGTASRFGAMGINYHFLPNVLAGVGLGLAKPCFGSTIALRREMLAAIGGFPAFASTLADDNAMGQAVRAKGYNVVMPPFAVRHACTEGSFRALWNHELRWMRTIRTVDPAGHAGSIVTHAISLALLGVIFSGFGALAFIALIASLAARGLLKWQIDKAFQGPAGPYWLLACRDVLSFAVFGLSLFGKRVVWQDAALAVRQDGQLSNR